MDLAKIGKEECENIKVVASKLGEVVVCDESDVAGDECENVKVVASKVGMQVVCDDEA